MKLWSYDYLDRLDDMIIGRNNSVVGNNRFKNPKPGDYGVVYAKVDGVVFAQAFRYIEPSDIQPWDKPWKYVYSVQFLSGITEVPFLTTRDFKRGGRAKDTHQVVFTLCVK